MYKIDGLGLCDQYRKRIIRIKYGSSGYSWASQVALEVKNSPANARDIKDVGSIPGSERSPGGGHGNPLQYSCLENPTDRGVWWAPLHSVTKS